MDDKQMQIELFEAWGKNHLPETAMQLVGHAILGAVMTPEMVIHLASRDNMVYMTSEDMANDPVIWELRTAPIATMSASRLLTTEGVKALAALVSAQLRSWLSFSKMATGTLRIFMTPEPSSHDVRFQINLAAMLALKPKE